MEPVRQQLETMLMLIAIVAGLLVGISVESTSLAVIGIAGAIVAFVVTDRLGMFQLDDWLANAASLAVLFFVFRNFTEGDHAQKLTSVAQLLVCLQTILMFQPKTPRLVWQIIILSLLQVVIAAIFTLNFEASFLFVVYFVLAGNAMMLQTVYSQQRQVVLGNERAQQRIQQFRSASAGTSRNALVTMLDQTPMVVQELSPATMPLWSNRLFQFGLWMIVSSGFAALAFCVLPRHTSPWYGPAVHQVTTAGMLTAVDLEQRGKVRLSKEVVFRASFEDFDTGKTLKNVGSPYFRAIAFSKIIVHNGRTSFSAPYDRVYPDEVYQRIPRRSRRHQVVRQIITLEKTTDPLVYEVMPVFRTRATPDEVEFCHEISAYTRCREQDQISVAPYKYETGTLVDHRGQFLNAWPFVSNTKFYLLEPLADDPEYRDWLLQMDRDRYAGVVDVARQIASDSQASGRLAMAKKMAQYFQQPDLFRYTLDFTEVRRDRRIDPIEDFFSNHRQGHCELYAAALTLMLRSQGIPARLVVGFHGSEFNTLTNSYFVRGTDAHAWVEVYLRPGDCTSQMVDEGSAGPGGAWYLLDPTPAGTATQDPAGTGTAIDLARSVWQDYVLGVDQESTSAGSGAVPASLVRLMASIGVEEIDDRLERARRWAANPNAKWLVAGWIVGLIALRFLLTWTLGTMRWNWQWPQVPARFRLLVADALAIIAPSLGSWVRGSGSGRQSTAFYRRMAQLLARRGWKRDPHQTHRAFAYSVASRVAEDPQGELIGQLVTELTEQFNAVRFGQQPLSEAARGNLQQQLEQLDAALGPAIGTT